MSDWFVNWLHVFAVSKKAQIALVCAWVLPLMVLAIGWLMTSRFELHGNLAPMAGVIRQIFADRFRGMAVFVCVSSLVIMVNTLKKDRKRIFGH